MTISKKTLSTGLEEKSLKENETKKDTEDIVRKDKQTKGKKKKPYVTLTVYDTGVYIRLHNKVSDSQLAWSLAQIVNCYAGYVCGISDADPASTVDELCALLKNNKDSIEQSKQSFLQAREKLLQR